VQLQGWLSVVPAAAILFYHFCFNVFASTGYQTLQKGSAQF
jgi:hypothetical protein